MTVNSIGVLGAGQMGLGIAQVAAQAGYETIMFDAYPEVLPKAMGIIEKLLSKDVEKGKKTEDDKKAILGRLKTTDTLTAMKNCQLVIEAAPEIFELKADLFQQLEEILSPDAILASNTSSLSITKIAGATKRPEKVVGMHFFNPVQVMRLVEIIKGLATTQDTFDTTVEVAKKMGKTTVEVKDSAAFLVNRILLPMINEAIYTVHEGIGSIEDVDTSIKLGLNHPMGPLTLCDFVGLDTILHVLEIMHHDLGDPKYAPCPLLRKMVEAGWYGKKSGRGFYQY